MFKDLHIERKMTEEVARNQSISNGINSTQNPPSVRFPKSQLRQICILRT